MLGGTKNKSIHYTSQDLFIYFLKNSNITLISDSSRYGILLSLTIPRNVDTPYVGFRPQFVGRDIRTICVKLQYVTENGEEKIICDKNVYTSYFSNKFSVKRVEFINECNTQMKINSNTSDLYDPLSPNILYCGLLNNNDFKTLIPQNTNSWFDVFYNCMNNNNKYQVGIIAMEMAGNEREFDTLFNKIDINPRLEMVYKALSLYSLFELGVTGYFQNDYHMGNFMIATNYKHYFKGTLGNNWMDNLRSFVIDYGRATHNPQAGINLYNIFNKNTKYTNNDIISAINIIQQQCYPISGNVCYNFESYKWLDDIKNSNNIHDYAVLIQQLNEARLHMISIINEELERRLEEQRRKIEQEEQRRKIEQEEQRRVQNATLNLENCPDLKDINIDKLKTVSNNKEYKKLALLLHPDKHPIDIEGLDCNKRANELFQIYSTERTKREEELQRETEEAQRRSAERRSAERRSAERRSVERRSAERRSAERRSAERRESEAIKTEQIAAERRAAAQRIITEAAQRRETEAAQRRETEAAQRRETEAAQRRSAERRATEAAERRATEAPPKTPKFNGVVIRPNPLRQPVVQAVNQQYLDVIDKNLTRLDNIPKKINHGFNYIKTPTPTSIIPETSTIINSDIVEPLNYSQLFLNKLKSVPLNTPLMVLFISMLFMLVYNNYQAIEGGGNYSNRQIVKYSSGKNNSKNNNYDLLDPINIDRLILGFNTMNYGYQSLETLNAKTKINKSSRKTKINKSSRKTKKAYSYRPKSNKTIKSSSQKRNTN